MGKNGLVLGGGGAKGSYQIGAWKAFEELGLEFDLIVGTSVGALNGALMTQGGFAKANDLWDGIEYHKIFSDESGNIAGISTAFDMVKFAVSEGILEGGLDSAQLGALLREAIDEDRVRQSAIDFGLVTVEFPRMKPVTPMKKDIPEGKLHDYLMASSACFPVLKPYEIDGVRYLDGGYYDNLPVSLAGHQGAQHIVAVDLEGIGFIREPKHQAFDLVTIRPYWDLGAVFDFDRNVFARNRELGYFDAMKAFGKMEGMHYTFFPGELRSNYERFEGRLWELITNVRYLVRRPAGLGKGTAEKGSPIVFLSRGRWGKDPADMLCRVAEIAGTVFSVSPTKSYTFEEFNRLLLREYAKRGRIFYQHEEKSADIARIAASVAQAVDRRQIAASIVFLLQRAKADSEPVRALGRVLPREYAAALYLKLLVDEQQAVVGAEEA